MVDQAKNVIIGMFVAAALAIIVFIILFLHPSTGDEGQVLYVRFADVDKINVGTRVTLAGKTIGEVVEIREVERGRDGPSDEYGHIYVYELKLLIDSHVKVYSTDQISARTSGLLGEKSVAILPIALKPGEVPRLVTKKDVLYAAEAGSVEDTMKEFKEVADKFDVALDNISMTLEDLRREEVIKKVADTMQNLSEITAALNKPEELSSTVANFEEFTSLLATRLPESWDTIDEILTAFNSSAENVHKITSTANNIVFKMGKGEGSLGKIVVTDDLYLRLTALLNKGETVLNDMNHYGLMYHLDKGWQRMRARRINLMEKLCTPQEFRNYFNDEIDQITTSLSRVSMVLDKTTFCSPYCYNLMDDCEFIKVFGELLRRVTSMEETLQLYNVEVVDIDVEKTELVDCNACN